MSFASGLFSFMGGASTQFREELDLAAQAKADKATADALERKEQKLLTEEIRQFDVIEAREQKKIGITQATVWRMISISLKNKISKTN
jgi:hypothetical protein